MHCPPGTPWIRPDFYFQHGHWELMAFYEKKITLNTKSPNGNFPVYQVVKHSKFFFEINPWRIRYRELTAHSFIWRCRVIYSKQTSNWKHFKKQIWQQNYHRMRCILYDINHTACALRIKNTSESDVVLCCCLFTDMQMWGNCSFLG